METTDAVGLDQFGLGLLGLALAVLNLANGVAQTGLVEPGLLLDLLHFLARVGDVLEVSSSSSTRRPKRLVTSADAASIRVIRAGSS